MSLFNVSHPYVLDGKPPTVRAFVGREQIDDLGRGTVAFAQQLLDDLELDATARACKVTLYRSAYWSGFPGDRRWQDAWPPVWQVDIAVDRAPRIPRYDDAEIATDAADDSFTRDQHHYRVHEFRCLVVADFRKKPAADAALAALRADDWSRFTTPLGVAAPEIRRGVWMGRGTQLQVDLGLLPESFYAAGAAYGVAVIDRLRALGGNVNIADIEDWV